MPWKQKLPLFNDNFFTTRIYYKSKCNLFYLQTFLIYFIRYFEWNKEKTKHKLHLYLLMLNICFFIEHKVLVTKLRKIATSVRFTDETSIQWNEKTRMSLMFSWLLCPKPKRNLELCKQKLRNQGSVNDTFRLVWRWSIISLRFSNKKRLRLIKFLFSVISQFLIRLFYSIYNPFRTSSSLEKWISVEKWLEYLAMIYDEICW